MTTPNENEVQGQEVEATPDTQYQGAAEPSGTDESGSQSDDLYAAYLEKFPTSLHPIARDVFKEWDGNVTKRIQSVHQEYEPYKPFVESYEPDAIEQALAIAEAMERDPQAFVDAMVNAYGLTPAQEAELQQQLNPDDDEDEFDPQAARLAQHEELLQTMAEAMLAERQEREQLIELQESEALYTQTMDALTEKYGEFDVEYVNTLLANGVDPDVAVQHWQSQVQTFAQRQLAPNQTAPMVMGAGGGTPSIQRDVENLSSQETKQLVAEMLRNAASNR